MAEGRAVEDPGDEADDALDGLPATMADLFLALVAVVVLMLLSLLPAIATPGALAPDGAEEPWRTGQARLDGGTPAIIVAEAGGLRLADAAVPGADPVSDRSGGRLVPLDALFSDADLAARLEDVARAQTPVLFVVEPDGGEAAFLFDALASRAGLATYAQMRLGSDCAVRSRGAACAPGAVGAP
ncbi:hypothetical protein [Antarcticirhabdus aurantiaca]|uniref:Uncharacterized protein n=1 Tax=Antarcticirhabdus aurantiaca TaxID=2606717 RepID=A0ACD4NUN7_9HYPH|nr:hypothetical protein [Antarcticirhabdus aurantiaca]WAJ30497.1 hypothetical protein OXU80_09960 [Jeongeuplla avenae]